ncbi:MAG TPA: hypothetical protein DCZ94_22735 [Lentisphaeria bacterium]|nr:MAG: hypothetical protein A2X48_13975 [Lentisphaerae bacterium GWF2_49_21]HBC89765.1 hypothetical protein [Lentisphaeria bacterium]
MQRIRIMSILLIFSFACLLLAQSPEMDKSLSPSEKEWLKKHPTMRLGVDSSSYFRGMIDDKGNYSGLGADYVRILEKKLGVSFKPELVPTWSEILEKARSKDIDVIPIVARTPEREDFLNFSETIVEMPNVIITGKSRSDIKNINDLEGKTVSVNKDYVIHEWLAKNHPKIVLRPKTDTEQGLKAVAVGEVDAYIGDLATAVYAINHLYLSNLKIAADTPFVVKWGIAVRKDWSEFIPILNKAILTISPEEHTSIRNKWTTFYSGVDIKMILLAVIPVIIVFILGTLMIANIRLKKEIEQKKLSEARLESLLKISHYKATGIQDLLDFALEEAISLTKSKIGYIYLYNEEKKEFILNSWSKDVMKECTITNPQTVYQLEKTGIWGEAVRQRKPILMNDFLSPHPLKKGYPEGHAKLFKYLTVPVYVEDKIVAVAAVANKETDYDQSDIRQLSLLMDSVWKYVERKEAEAERERLIKDLQKALSEVKVLSGLLPICAKCKKIRDDKGYWAILESYFMKHTDTKFSHGICPDCMKSLYPELARSMESQKSPPEN